MKSLNKQKGSVLVVIVGCILALSLLVLIAISWVKNLSALTDCDFEPNTSYKCEVLHGIGVIPVISIFTAWVDTGK
jgi:hypothetical protein